MFPDGNSISFAEVANIKRAVAPKRAIVLVTCSAGGASGEYLSLAETMLANNLATTVFASPSAVDASRVPSIVEKLQSEDIRDTLEYEGFEQYVMENQDDYFRA